MAGIQRKVSYGEANYKTLVEENGYYVDKTFFIERLEDYRNVIYLRPRRFGKSLLCTTLQYYYDINHAGEFEALFGKTYVGQHPTSHHNRYLVLHFDFSGLPNDSYKNLEEAFHAHINNKLHNFVQFYKDFFPEPVSVDLEKNSILNLELVLNRVLQHQTPPLYVIIDEYDNVTNQLVTSYQDTLYQQVTAESGFLKQFFKVLKKGRKERSIYNIFITGILPITIDDLASAFNVGEYLTLDPDFEAMIGFTQAEVDVLLDQIYEDYHLDRGSFAEVQNLIRIHYNGYRFSLSNGPRLYNSTILMRFLGFLSKKGRLPDSLIDMNLKTDLSWIQRLTSSNPENTKALVDQLLTQGTLDYNSDDLSEQKFNLASFFTKSFYPVAFFYLGLVTRENVDWMRLPNLNMKRIFTGYFNELHQIDVSSRYHEVMSAFRKSPDLLALFEGYWNLYIGQLPEAIFNQVNENFYRTSFLTLCSSYLSTQYTFLVESSNPAGRTDLEIVGRFDSDRAGIRFLLEFKYFSNAQMKRNHLSWKDFVPPEADRTQVLDYDNHVRKQHPKAQLHSYLIYCFGNQGFHIAPVT